MRRSARGSRAFRSRRKLQFRQQCCGSVDATASFRRVHGCVIFHSVRFHFPDGDVDVLSPRDGQTMRFAARLIFVSFFLSLSLSLPLLPLAICFFRNYRSLRQELIANSPAYLADRETTKKCVIARGEEDPRGRGVSHAAQNLIITNYAIASPGLKELITTQNANWIMRYLAVHRLKQLCLNNYVQCVE